VIAIPLLVTPFVHDLDINVLVFISSYQFPADKYKLCASLFMQRKYKIHKVQDARVYFKSESQFDYPPTTEVDIFLNTK
jgi:hypothetical protein